MKKTTIRAVNNTVITQLPQIYDSYKYLSSRLDPFPDTKVAGDPHNNYTRQYFPPDAAYLLDPPWDSQHSSSKKGKVKISNSDWLGLIMAHLKKHEA